jgi:hypothetical protein
MEVTLLPRSSVKCREIFQCLILRNSVQFRRIPYNSLEFRDISSTEFRLRNLSNKFIQETLDFLY